MGLIQTLRRAAPVGRLDMFRASVGAMAGVLATALAAQALAGFGGSAPLLTASIGSSAVLAFALPASPMAQPWPVIGGNVVSALVGWICATLVPDPNLAGALAVAAAIVAMRLCRCLHPPGGAVALSAVVGGATVHAAGWTYAFAPVALNAAALVAAAWAYNNLTGHSYPHRPPMADLGRADDVGRDIDAVLAASDELLDVSREDLASVIRQVEVRAHARLGGDLRCAAVMSTPSVILDAEEPADLARERLVAARLVAAPVTDAGGRLVGEAGMADLLGGGRRPVRTAMAVDPLRVEPQTSVEEIIPALAGEAPRQAMVTAADGRLVGLITPADLLSALWRAQAAKQAAS